MIIPDRRADQLPGSGDSDSADTRDKPPNQKYKQAGKSRFLEYIMRHVGHGCSREREKGDAHVRKIVVGVGLAD